ncbi:MAG TPA: Gfo/Idh/MocA family oxidoreductase [Candidatus Limnocylindrales bacterium]|nr:Gfo/Idh/MocA family oxidoreductase [Candidatus Limnocylindrales bacterium]
MTLRIAIVGCGDVATRHYLPGIRGVANLASVVALADPREGAAEAVAASIAEWSPGALSYRAVEAMLGDQQLDGVFNLTPAPLHGAVNEVILDNGVALFSEKPIAGGLPAADALIALAHERDVLFQAATGSAVTGRTRWLKDLAASGSLGKPTLAVAHHADPGPASWREYTGDPTPFYREGVGPLFDHGVYRLHEMTTVLGPVERVQAMGSIALPARQIHGGPKAGQQIEVNTEDHVMVHLEFRSGALGQLLASFAAHDTLAPWLEIQFERGAVSFGGKSWERDAPVSIFEADAAGEGHGWRAAAEAPVDDIGTVEAGAQHFIRCLAGLEESVLSAEHARHVLEVMLLTYASIADGRAHETTTTY